MRRLAVVVLCVAAMVNVSAQVQWQKVDTYTPTETSKGTVVYVTNFAPFVSGYPLGEKLWNLEQRMWHLITPNGMVGIPSNAVGIQAHAHLIHSGGQRDSADPNPINYCGGYVTTRAPGSLAPGEGYNAAYTTPATPIEPIQRTDRPHGNGIYLVAGGERQSATFTVPMVGGRFEFWWSNADDRCTNPIIHLEVDKVYLPVGEMPAQAHNGPVHWSLQWVLDNRLP